MFESDKLFEVGGVKIPYLGYYGTKDSMVHYGGKFDEKWGKFCLLG